MSQEQKVSHDGRQELVTKLYLSSGIPGAYFVDSNVIKLYPKAIITKFALFFG